MRSIPYYLFLAAITIALAECGSAFFSLGVGVDKLLCASATTVLTAGLLLLILDKKQWQCFPLSQVSALALGVLLISYIIQTGNYFDVEGTAGFVLMIRYLDYCLAMSKLPIFMIALPCTYFAMTIFYFVIGAVWPGIPLVFGYGIDLVETTVTLAVCVYYLNVSSRTVTVGTSESY